MKKIIEEAFSLWSNVTNLNFTQEETGFVHIDIKFTTGDPLDGPGVLRAFAESPHVAGGEIIFDDDEIWTVERPIPVDGRDLLTVATHEIGHALGLAHSLKKSAIMADGRENMEIPQLDVDDVAAIQSLYGVPGEERPHYENLKDVELIGMTDIPVLVTNIRNEIDKLQKMEIDFLVHARWIDKYNLKILVKPTSEAQFANDVRRPLERNLEAIEKRGGKSINRSFHRKIILIFHQYQDRKALEIMKKQLLLAKLNSLKMKHDLDSTGI